MTSLSTLFLEGFLLQASLIFALGAQNLYVLESGLQRRRPIFVATMCSICDAAMVLIGVMGAGSLFVQFPLFKIIFGILGAAFLLYYGVSKILEKPTALALSNSSLGASTTKRVALQSLAFSLLNPHVYLDTMVLIGGFSAQFPELLSRTFFGLGSAFYSVIWFFALALLASRASRYLNNPKAMRWVYMISGLILVSLSFSLSMDIYLWCCE